MTRIDTAKTTTLQTGLSMLDAFDNIIDVRSPAEFNEDHIPGALNLPVLDDAQRCEVGILYKQSKHEAKRVGAGMVSENIAAHLRGALADKPQAWTPLIYCWRGGERSASFAHVLRRVGWKAECLEGGYKTYRRWVREELEHISNGVQFRILCGKTGVGKSRLLKQLAARGAQVLDLEGLANHRGSVFGDPATGEQPTQKFFDSLLCRAMRGMDKSRVIFVEAESQRIGSVQLSPNIMEALRASPCVQIDSDLAARIAFIVREYPRFLEQPELLEAALEKLVPFVGRESVNQWIQQCSNGETDTFVRDILQMHYDPIYTRSMRKNFAHFDTAAVKHIECMDDAHFDRVAGELIKEDG